METVNRMKIVFLQQCIDEIIELRAANSKESEVYKKTEKSLSALLVYKNQIEDGRWQRIEKWYEDELKHSGEPV